MKKLFFSILLSFPFWASAQVLDVNVGNVTYRYNAEECGEMIYGNDGTTLTIAGKTYSLTAIDGINVTANASVSSNTVSVTYSSSSAKVIVAGNIAANLTVDASTTDVSIVQDANVSEEIVYSLSGTCTDGSFYHDGEFKATFVLSDLTLTNPTGPAFRTDDGKRIGIDLEGTNTLSDGTGSTAKAAMMVNGHTEFTGSGTLNISGNYKHAFWGDEYVLLKKTLTGSVNIVKSVKDGMNINQYLQLKGGTLNISGSIGDDGIQVGMDESEIEDDGKIIVNDGTLTVAVTADGAKALKADSTINIKGGTLTLSSTGGVLIEDGDTSVCAAMKSDYAVKVSGGTLVLSTKGNASKTINSDGKVELSGGQITLTNSGTVYGSGKYMIKAFGIKSDGEITVSDDADVNITMSGAGSKGIKADTNLNVTGGSLTSTNSGKYAGSGNYLSGASAIKGETAINITGGVVTAKATGQGGKGISSDGSITISNGTVTASATGSNYSYGNYSKAAKGMKADGNLEITGGTVVANGTNHEAIEAKGTITISDGTVTATSSNDAINSGSHMYLKGGTISAYSSGNDAIDSNGNLYISGGNIVGIGGSGAESGIDVGEKYSMIVTGGNFFGIGGRIDATLESTTQGIISTSGSVSKNSTVTVSNGNTTLATFTMPGSYNNGTIMVSAEGMVSDTSYTLNLGSSSVSAKASNTLSSSGGNQGGPGGPGGPGGQGGQGGRP